MGAAASPAPPAHDGPAQQSKKTANQFVAHVERAAVLSPRTETTNAVS
jgi:hypothetical protein